MNKSFSIHSTKRAAPESGFGLIEIVVTLSLIGTLFAATSQLLALTINQQRIAENDSRSVFLAQDAIEAAKNVRTRSWETLKGLQSDTVYYPVIVSGEWKFMEGSESIAPNFTRAVRFLKVFRDENGAIVEQGGTEDDTMRKVVATVTWPYQGTAKTNTVAAYVTDWSYANGFLNVFTQTNLSDFRKGATSLTDIQRQPGNIRLDYTMLLNENFNSYAANVDPTNWTDTDKNYSLATNNALFKTASNSSTTFGTTSTLSNIHTHYTGPGASSWTNVEVTGRMMLTNTSGSLGIAFFSRYPATDKYYLLGNTDADKSFMISGRNTSITPSGVDDRDTEISPIANTWYRFRIQAKDVSNQTLIVAKIWLDGADEPESWQVDCFDDSPARSTAGTIGVWASGTGSKYVDDLQVRNLSEYSAAGNYTSMAFDSGGASFFDAVQWLADVPFGTNVKAQIRSADTKAGIESAPWYGPTGAGDYYDLNGAETKINRIHTGDRWIQYQTTLSTSASASSPSFEEIHITYANQ